jgi:hypothetical protein
MVLGYIQDFLVGIINSVPEQYRLLINLGFYTIFIAIYAVFIWKFYKFLASREILSLNLKQYNLSERPGLEKFLAIVLFSVEYLVILPFLVFFWFTILALFLLLLSESNPEQILLVSAAIIASTRITAYIGEDLSKDLAKILPFTVLATFLLNPNFFNTLNIVGKFTQIPALFNSFIIYIIFIFIIEYVLRSIYSIAQLFASEQSNESNVVVEKSK